MNELYRARVLSRHACHKINSHVKNKDQRYICPYAQYKGSVIPEESGLPVILMESHKLKDVHEGSLGEIKFREGVEESHPCF